MSLHLKCISHKSRRAAGWVCDRILPKPWRARVKRWVGCMCLCRKRKIAHWQSLYNSLSEAKNCPRGHFPNSCSQLLWLWLSLMGVLKKGLGYYSLYFRARWSCRACKSARLFFTKLQKITSHSNCSVNFPVCIDNRFQLQLLGTNTAATGTIDQLSGWKSGRH